MEKYQNLDGVRSFIDNNLEMIESWHEIAVVFGVSNRALTEYFITCHNISIREYITRKKIFVLGNLIRQTKGEQLLIFYAHALGFSTESGLHNLIKRKTGLGFTKYKELTLNRCMAEIE